MERRKIQICKQIRINAENYFQTSYFNGRCGYLSLATAIAFMRRGIPNKLCHGIFNCKTLGATYHYWVVSNRLIYDLTVEQFNLKEVVYPKVFIASSNFSKYILESSIMSLDKQKLFKFMHWTEENNFRIILDLIKNT